MPEAIVTGSLRAVARRRGRPLAEQFLDVEHVALVDVSPSMEARDGPGGRARIDVAQEALAVLQAEFPGRIAVFAFADGCRLVAGGVPRCAGGGTDLAGALRTTRPYDGLVARFVLISDGEPDDPEGALEIARAYRTPISTVYCGPEGGPGGPFLQRLAAVAGGRHADAARAAGLADAVRPLLLGAGPAGGSGRA